MPPHCIDIALDIGGVAVKAVAFDGEGRIVERRQTPIRGQLRDAVRETLLSLVASGDDGPVRLRAITGSNAPAFTRVFNLAPVDALIACYRGTTHLEPEAGAILEIGGEHAAFLLLERSPLRPRPLKDFRLNSVCSAGTGSFLEQEAHRLRLTIAQFAGMAAASAADLDLAGRCAVFAKTDAVHLQQNGVTVPEIAGAFCRMAARSVASELVASAQFDRPLLFVGGVASNAGVVRFLSASMSLDERAFIVPGDHLYANAIGAYLHASEDPTSRSCRLVDALQELDGHALPVPCARSFRKPLGGEARSAGAVPLGEGAARALDDSAHPLTLGIDIGSTSVNVACVTRRGHIVCTRSGPTRGRPAEVTFELLGRVRDRFPGGAPSAVGITGSGRQFMAALLGGDLTVNEITAHAAAASHFWPGVDTVIDIGGQDAKFIRLENGRVTSFEMNKVCSAGTGSFLEEMAELLGLRIIDEFAAVAIRSTAPAELGERCTVFVSSELRRRQQQGASREDLAAGLAYAVARNYVSRVMGRHAAGRNVSFQGGVAGNPAVHRALEESLDREIIVHEHHEAAGAIGAALLAGRDCAGPSRFRGFAGLDAGLVQSKAFRCGACSNRCTITTTATPDRARFYAGGLCDRYESGTVRPGRVPSRGARPELPSRAELGPDPLAGRDTALRADLRETRDDPLAIGIPHILLSHELLPFWTAFLSALDIPYRLSDATTRQTVQRGFQRCPAHPCLPILTAYGHCADLIAAGVRRVFAPSIANLAFCTKAERLSHICPAAQAWPYTAKAIFGGEAEFLTPRIRFADRRTLESDLVGFGHSLGFGRREVVRAVRQGFESQQRFHSVLAERGKDILTRRSDGGTRLVLLSRPYTICDPLVQSRLRSMFADLGVTAIPMEMIPGSPATQTELDGMYWYYGRRMMQTARAIAGRNDVAAVHLSHFGCGSDSFLVHFLRRIIPRGRLLEIELDQHSELTGLRTRLEAFLCALKDDPGQPALGEQVASVPSRRRPGPSARAPSTLLIPQMSEHSFGVAAAFRSCGVQTEVLPMPDRDSVSKGKDVVGGQECLPCVMVLGDYLKRLGTTSCADGKDGNGRRILFMVSGDGPCRLGQYPYLQRLILDANGHADVPIFDASQDPRFYERLDGMSSALKLRAWRGMVATDVILRCRRKFRPYAPEKAAFDVTFREELESLSRCIEASGDLEDTMRRTVARLRGYRRDGPPRPVVALVGENYVRCNQAANGGIADLLEDRGVEVSLPALTEWIFYTNWTARQHCLFDRDYVRYVRLLLVDRIQRAHGKRLTRAACIDDQPGGTSLSSLLHLASRYVPRSLEGEVIVAIGETIEASQQGAAGVIHVAPFGCMGGTVFQSLAERMSMDLEGLPILALEFDGRLGAELDSRLDAFLMRVRSRSASGKAAKG